MAHFLHFKHSLWDRLITAETIGSAVGTTTSSEIERIKDSVRRDLEWLLNTKSPLVDLPTGPTALDPSLVTYGLPDISSLSPHNSRDLEKFQRTLEKAIRHFEPRLTRVRVEFTPNETDKHRSSLHYRIDALLRLDPATEPIVFDTFLNLGNRAFKVERKGS